MTRLLTEGAEFGDVLWWTSSSSTTASTTYKRSGAYSYAVGSSARKDFTAASEVYLRIAIYNPGDMLTNGIQLRNSTTIIGSVGRNATSKLLEIRIGTTLDATGSIQILSDTWYLLEWHLKIDNTTGISEVKVDGIADVTTGTKDTQPGAATTVDNLNIASNAGGNTTYVDDIALNNTSGGSDDSWCGDAHIILLNPDGDVGSPQWVGSDADSTNNYALIDEIPALSTDYVEASTSGYLDLYNLEACGLSNVTIHRIWPEARGADTVAEGGQIYLPVKAGSTQVDGTAVTLLTTYTKQLLGDVRKVNPDDSAAWEPSDLDSLQVGVKVV